MLNWKDYVGLLALGVLVHIGLALYGAVAHRAKVACILDGGDPAPTWYGTIDCPKLPKE